MDACLAADAARELEVRDGHPEPFRATAAGRARMPVGVFLDVIGQSQELFELGLTRRALILIDRDGSTPCEAPIVWMRNAMCAKDRQNDTHPRHPREE